MTLLKRVEGFGRNEKERKRAERVFGEKRVYDGCG